MRYGVLVLPEHPWETASRIWQTAEALGFAHAWTYDHLTWRSQRNSPWFAAIPTLTAAACATTSIRLGTLVASPNFREPSPFAKELMTLDDISDGRLTLGFGAGSDGFDATAIRNHVWSSNERQERFSEFVDIMDRVLRNPQSSASGRYYVANEARIIPACKQTPRIPFALAATGQRGMRVVAKHAQTWVGVDSRGAGKKQIEMLDRALGDAGRDPAAVARLVLLGHVRKPLSSADEFARVSDEYAQMGFTDLVVHWPRSTEPFAATMDVLEKAAKLIAPAG